MVNCGCLSVASFPLKLLNVHYCSGDSNNLSDHQKVPSVVLQKKTNTNKYEKDTNRYVLYENDTVSNFFRQKK